ncbi:hypothetical protein ccbrp13_23470 [Ktedonobacteria bacterium brp13]|nr:hypothetical protein ccbrp13_23470 [Ktedonobacteria bacterium brp13]
MVPADFANFFTVMAGVGATLFGLIFLVISIKPEITNAENTSVMRQAQVASSYSALLNPLVISLIALVPDATIGTVTLIMSSIGLINTIIMGVSLLRDSKSGVKKLKSVFFILVSLVIFSIELFYAIRLVITPGDLFALYNLAILLVIIYLYGIARAWDLVGARQFHIQEMFAPLLPKRMEEISSDTPHAESTKDANK